MDIYNNVNKRNSLLVLLNSIEFCPCFCTPKNLNFDELKISGRSALLCKCLSGLMQSYCYLQKDLSSIYSMMSLQAILSAFQEVVPYAL